MNETLDLTYAGNGQPFPDVTAYLNNGNPTLCSPSSPYELPMMQTKDSMVDVDLYNRFIHNAINLFRGLKFYKNYKAYLMEMGLDHCQVLHNIDSNMATLEMNHCILTIFDITVMITEHFLNTYGYVSVPHVVAELRFAHANNLVPIVMMSKTVHQLYHNADNFYTHPNQVFGKWTELFKRYYNGITPDICTKVLYYIRTAYEEGDSVDDDILEVAEEIKNWSEKTYASYISTLPAQSPYCF